MRRQALVSLVGVALMVAGAVAAARLPGPVSTTIVAEGLRLSVSQVRWVHHEGHDPRVPMPSSMMFGAPEDGSQRLSLELEVENRSPRVAFFSPAELVARAAEGEVPGASSDGERFTLPPGTRLAATVRFDVPEQDGELDVSWARDTRRHRLLVTQVPRHELPEVIAWPALVTALPPGDAENGRRLFATRGCSACHGSLETVGGATLGPELAGVHAEAAARRPGMTAAQYLYESMLEPDAFVAPRCAGGRPCASPSAMPAFDRTLEPSEAADLVAALLAPENGGFR